jgi:hypothetical protein
VDYAQEENWNEANELVQDVDDIIAHDSDTQRIWHTKQTFFQGTKNFIYWTVWASEKS